jgi:hypothetical protein
MNKIILLEEGFWVKGKSVNGEIVLGYIENINSLSGTVKVKVVESDNEEIKGRTIEMLQRSISKLPDNPLQSEGEVLSLIDIALLTRDQEWFDELSKQYFACKRRLKNTKSVARFMQ